LAEGEAMFGEQEITYRFAESEFLTTPTARFWHPHPQRDPLTNRLEQYYHKTLSLIRRLS
jgi:hypothetical protein